jgi:hypothetical protein
MVLKGGDKLKRVFTDSFVLDLHPDGVVLFQPFGL